jgi:hypothetical protein
MTMEELKQGKELSEAIEKCESMLSISEAFTGRPRLGIKMMCAWIYEGLQSPYDDKLFNKVKEAFAITISELKSELDALGKSPTKD